MTKNTNIFYFGRRPPPNPVPTTDYIYFVAMAPQCIQ